MKKYLTIILACMLSLSSFISVEAATDKYDLNTEDELLESTAEIMPYAKYIMNVQTTIIKKSSSSVGIRAEVYCSEKVSKIDIKFYLQKKSGSSWVTVGTNNITVSDVASTTKSITATGVSSGTYRARVTAKVTDRYGYSESATSTTGEIRV